VKVLDPVLEKMRKRDKDWKKAQGKETDKILSERKKKKEVERKTKLVLRSTLPKDQRPTSLEQFKPLWHHPPVPQFYTGTCWSFCTTSFLESEIHRITGKKIKLSEMSSVYWEYVAKAMGYVKKRGKSLFAEGSESNAVTRALKTHGAWPAKTYPGVAWKDGRHDHQRMKREMKAVLAWASSKSLWDLKTVVSMVRVILDRDMGRPPAQFQFEGKTLKPDVFMKDVCRINPDDYVEFISTLKFPFWTQGEFKVPDNWWHDKSYYNIPLKEFYEGLKGAVQKGYSVVIAVDVSEPGKDPENDILFVPEYDIPIHRIDQLAREYRFAHRVTTDDHGVHLVGYTRHAGHDWFLIKDSGRSSRRGKHKGYYFIRGDYIRLKVLAFMVHRKGVEHLLAKFKTRKTVAKMDPVP
jgi:bleomycin hydrolase